MYIPKVKCDDVVTMLAVMMKRYRQPRGPGTPVFYRIVSDSAFGTVVHYCEAQRSTYGF
jgi:hypothetical protein